MPEYLKCPWPDVDTCTNFTELRGGFIYIDCYFAFLVKGIEGDRKGEPNDASASEEYI